MLKVKKSIILVLMIIQLLFMCAGISIAVVDAYSSENIDSSESLPVHNDHNAMGFIALSDDTVLLTALCKKMRALFETLREKDGNVEFLSMGMSGDWRLCVENGSNMIRLGTSLFGPRRYPAAENTEG